MTRRACTTVLVLLSLSILTFFPAVASAQEPSTVVTPQQLRRAEPPSPTATAAELERQADELREQKMFSDSLDYYKAAMAKGTRTAEIYNKIGIAEMQLTRLGDAKKDFERAIKLNKTFPEPYNNLGVVHYIRKKYKNAIKEYLKAVALRE